MRQHTRVADRKEPVLERYSFSGHESFPFRFAWLPKGVQGVLDDPDLFINNYAPVTLGVGKNMVNSIRHWCLALAMVAPEGSKGQMRATNIGRLLFGPDGWDPYLEDVGTLWLLHWILASRGERASTWHLAFTRWNATSFTRDQLVSWLTDIVRDSSSTRATLSSLRRDVDVFVRTYTPANPTRDLSLEDSFDCPLVELGLLREVEPRRFLFTRGSRLSLTSEIFAFALLDHWERRFSNQRTLSFENVQSGAGSPGAAFKLTEASLAEHLETLPTWTGLRYDETAGTRVVLRTGDLLPDWQISALRHYFDRDYVGLRQAELSGSGAND